MGVSMFLIIIFCIRYYLFGEVKVDFLILISVYCVEVYFGLELFYNFMKYFYYLKNLIICYKYCLYCLLFLNDVGNNLMLYFFLLFLLNIFVIFFLNF